MNQYYCTKCDSVVVNHSLALTVTADCGTCKTKTSQRLLAYKGKPDPKNVEGKPITGSLYFDSTVFHGSIPKGPVKASDLVPNQAKHDAANADAPFVVPTAKEMNTVVEQTAKAQRTQLDVSSGSVKVEVNKAVNA